jgi:hypothetical protein
MVFISKEEALKACKAIRSRNRDRIISFAKIQCWGCLKYSHGDEALLCFNSAEGNRGCSLVNKEFDKK